jgi:hypothetical protein
MQNPSIQENAATFIIITAVLPRNVFKFKAFQINIINSNNLNRSKRMIMFLEYNYLNFEKNFAITFIKLKVNTITTLDHVVFNP